MSDETVGDKCVWCDDQATRADLNKEWCCDKHGSHNTNTNFTEPHKNYDGVCDE